MGTNPGMRFKVPGGHIDVSLQPDGFLRIHGVNNFGTHSSQLTIRPESANDITVSLTEVPLEPEPVLHVTMIGQHSGHWDASCSGCSWSLVNFSREREQELRRLAREHKEENV